MEPVHLLTGSSAIVVLLSLRYHLPLNLRYQSLQNGISGKLMVLPNSPINEICVFVFGINAIADPQLIVTLEV